MDDKDFFKGFGLLAVVTVLTNLLLIAGIIWFALWALQQFGVI
jgi:hypothetical protein